MKFSRWITLSLAGLAAIAALSGCGSNSNPLAVEQPADTTPPPAPVNLAVSADMAGSPILVWDASAAPDVAAYQVEIMGAGGFEAVSDPIPTDTSYLLPEVTISTEQSYRVRAVDTSGNWSPFSATTTIMVPAPGSPNPIDIN